jgi:ribonucleoside-diphosphate reductase alpha chain
MKGAAIGLKTRLGTSKKLPLQLTENGLRVLQARYLKRDEQGNFVETPEELFTRVARVVAEVERTHGTLSEPQIEELETAFYNEMATQRFMPNSPTLMNAGREMGMLSACFVLPVGDSINEIFDTVKATALIQKAGGGTGFAFDRLRPTGDFIQSSGGTTSGPISFWRVLSEATNAIQQGAFRRGANMGMMSITHPDILKFIEAKQDLSQFTNYNISVKVPDAYMEELKAAPDAPHAATNPRTGRTYYLPKDYNVRAHDLKHLIPTEQWEGRGRPPVWTRQEIFDLIVDHAWQTGEPGVAFIDRINEENPTPHLGEMEATNPCGEQPLLPHEACNLGSLNLAAFVVRERGLPRFDYDSYRESVHLCTRFLDDIIDANNYPTPEIDRMCKGNRKIGLGVMGYADALYRLGIPYHSEEAVVFAEGVMKFTNDESHNASEALAQEKGCFPYWEGSRWDRVHRRKMRNACTTTVAPTGTISIIANCSGGIEPLFSLAFFRNVLDGQRLVETNDYFRQTARDQGFFSPELMERIAREGSLEHIEGIPEETRKVFVCAHDITPEWHIRTQAAFQKHCDSSISKTINFPETATREQVERIYRMAYETRCKGVTVYRDGCRKNQPMALDNQARRKPAEPSAAAPATEREAEFFRKPIEVPEIMSCLRIRQRTPFGNMHVKICVEPGTGVEREVFAQLGKGGDVANSDLEAICRLLSLFLRSNGALQLAVRQLEGIGSSLTVPSKEGRIMSLADGLARAIKKYLRFKKQFGLKTLLLGEYDPAAEPTEPATSAAATQAPAHGNGNGKENPFKIHCPECDTPLVFEEGCAKCHGCGFSQC